MNDKAFPKDTLGQYGMTIADYFVVRIAQSIVEKFPHESAATIADRSWQIANELVKRRRL